jgi:hypothetical protein
MRSLVCAPNPLHEGVDKGNGVCTLFCDKVHSKGEIGMRWSVPAGTPAAASTSLMG